MSSPYFHTPAPERPRMYRSTLAKVVWTLVPVASMSLLAPLPFVVAARKGVIQMHVAIAYGAIEAMILLTSQLLGDDPRNWTGLMLVVMMLVAAVHTALLDDERVVWGK